MTPPRSFSLLLLLLAGCPRPLPIHFGPEGRIGSSQRLWELLRAHARALRELSATASARVSEQGKSSTASENVAAARPGNLRIEVLDIFGNPRAVLVTTGARFALFDADHATYYRGAATPIHLMRLVPLPLTPAEWVALLLGSAPTLPAAQPAELSVRGDAYVLMLRQLPAGLTTDASYVEEIHARIDDLRVLQVTRTTSLGQIVFDARFHHFEMLPQGPFPRHIEVRSPEASVLLRYHDLSLNPQPALPATAFEIPIPPGAKVVELH